MIFDAVQLEQFEDDAVVQMFLRKQNDRGVFRGVVVQSEMFDVRQHDVILIECWQRTRCRCRVKIGRGAADRRWTPEAKCRIVKQKDNRLLKKLLD